MPCYIMRRTLLYHDFGTLSTKCYGRIGEAAPHILDDWNGIAVPLPRGHCRFDADASGRMTPITVLPDVIALEWANCLLFAARCLSGACWSRPNCQQVLPKRQNLPRFVPIQDVVRTGVGIGKVAWHPRPRLEPLRIQEPADDPSRLEALARELEIRSPVLGWSFGWPISSEVAGGTREILPRGQPLSHTDDVRRSPASGLKAWGQLGKDPIPERYEKCRDLVHLGIGQAKAWHSRQDPGADRVRALQEGPQPVRPQLLPVGGEVRGPPLRRFLVRVPVASPARQLAEEHGTQERLLLVSTGSPVRGRGRRATRQKRGEGVGVARADPGATACGPRR